MKFKLYIPRIFYIFLIGSTLLVATLFFLVFYRNQDFSWANIFISFLYVPMSLWHIHQLFFTKVCLEEASVVYHQGLFTKVKIPYQNIQHVGLNQVPNEGFYSKRLFGQKGIRIFYNKFDEVYINPKKQKLFIEELQKKGPFEIKK